MNTYNDNLHATVMDSLHSQELEKKSTQSTVNISIFSLYYADDAKVTAIEKYNKVRNTLLEKALVKKQAIENNTTSSSVLTASNNEKEYVDRAASNAANSARNVQIAATAIVKLASDIGSIFTILGAADFSSNLYQECNIAYEKISETAYCAEVTSQHAMEASTLTAKVTAGTVLERATVSNRSVTELLEIAKTEYNSVSAIVDKNNANMEIANKVAMAAQSVLEKSHLYNLAAASVYKKINRDSNMNLSVPIKSQSSEGFTVDFNFIKMPFATTTDSLLYPVQNYYVMIVKEKKTAIFSMSDAENVLQKNTTEKPLFIKYPVAGKMISAGTDSCSIKVNCNDAFDTDGEPIELGQNYTVFVLAVYETAYKKNLNNFEDYLSAPSSTFMLTDQLISPNFDQAKIGINNNANNMCVIDNVLTFSVSGNNDKNVAYRCMFLPQENDLTRSTLSKEAMEKKINFIFNDTLAPHVAIGNYLLATQIVIKGTPETINGSCIIEPGTTDIFGNLLVNGNFYTPVVLTISNENGQDAIKYSNSLSAYNSTPMFKYES